MSDSETQYTKIRREKASKLREISINPFPNGISASDKISDIIDNFGSVEAEGLESDKRSFSIAGRIMAIRAFGKAAFLQIKDRTGKLQIFVQKQTVGDECFNIYKMFDVGDIAYFEGVLFRTKTGELTLNSSKLSIVTKSFRPLPEKWHGLTDVEMRYRQRYVDLIVNDPVRDTFVRRSKIIQAIRDFMTSPHF